MPDRDPILDSVIGLDATYAVGKELSGVGKYSLRLIEELKRLHPKTRFRSYYRTHRILAAPFPKRILFGATPSGLDLFHGLNQRVPAKKRAPAISTFHDLFVLSGAYSTKEFRERFAAQAKEAAHGSDRIIAVSRFTANQVVEFLGYPAERISVVPHGVDQPAKVHTVDAREPIVLTVGAIQKRKNTRRLIQAMKALPQEWQLWIAGGMGFEAKEMLRDLPANRTVRVLGYVSDEELAKLYRQAAIFAFPSLDEGFGIPVLEAMANGVPVLTSNCSALPEVAGDAALLVDPIETDAIAKGLVELSDLERRRDYFTRGLARAKEFSWERAGRLTAEAYGEVIGRLRRAKS